MTDYEELIDEIMQDHPEVTCFIDLDTNLKKRIIIEALRDSSFDNYEMLMENKNPIDELIINILEDTITSQELKDKLINGMSDHIEKTVDEDMEIWIKKNDQDRYRRLFGLTPLEEFGAYG